MGRSHPLVSIPIRGDNEEDVRDALRLLPETTFLFADQFVRGFRAECDNPERNIGIYAEQNSLVGENGGVALIAVNSHLFGDPTTPEDNPNFRVPDGARNVIFCPGRMPPRVGGLYAGVEFEYKGKSFFFGYRVPQQKF